MSGRRHLIAIGLAVAAVVVGIAIASQGQSGDGRNDAMLFLDRIEGLDVEDPIEERRAQVGVLAGLPLHAESVVEVRDLCVSAHSTLIRAEDRSAEARSLFDEASAHGTIEVSTEIAARIEDAIADSDRAIEEARTMLPRCMQRVETLRSRYTSRRHEAR